MKKLFNKLFPITFEIYENLSYYEVYEYRKFLKFITVKSSFWLNSLKDASNYIAERKTIITKADALPKLIYKERM